MTAVLDERPAAPVSRGGLREFVRHLDVPKGYRTEIIGGCLVMSPTPSLKHGATVRRFYDQFAPQLPTGMVAQQVVSIAAPDDSEDYCWPDLAVLPEDAEDEEGWLVPADAVDFVLEVVSPGNSANDTVIKPEEYAHWQIPLYLIVDPREGAMRLYWDPVDGTYRAQKDHRFGETLTLPEPLKDVRIDTSGFPVYGEKPRNEAR